METIAVKVNEAIIARDSEKNEQYSGLVEQGYDYEVYLRADYSNLNNIISFIWKVVR